MKATLEFNLPEEQDEYDLCMSGPGYAAFVETLCAWIRQETKYNDRKELTFDELKEKLIELTEEYLRKNG